MYLKELMLRGFKSFASATTLRFEPGITAVVGPNGSGKSNIVDALTWVMGEQGAKNLRGTSMEDVIFAGTSSRPPLGRAQVSLTIDNTDHALDIDYTEVTISRTIFRNGGSEYAINGSPCRLLDIQELLSDTGLGQQMHVIVGQGRLDQILKADPSGHRAFIEEAAGILKHRKRKERALRKLANTETNLSRLDDLLGEIHRQLGPLGRQARVSRRADGIQVTLRDAMSRLYADDAQRAMARRDAVRADLTRVRGELNAMRHDLARVKIRIEQVEAMASASSPAIAQANQQWHELSRIEERLRSLASVAEERARSLEGQMTAVPGEDPDLLNRRADELAAQTERQRQTAQDARLAFDKATETRADHEQRLASVRQTLIELRRMTQRREAKITNLREMIAREEAAVQLAATRSKDFAAQRDQLERQHGEAVAQRDALERARDTDDADDGTDALDEARRALATAQDALNDLQDRQRELNGRIISLKAKADALHDTLDSRTASGALERDPDVRSLGRLTDFIRVADGWEDAVAHALDAFAGAIVVPDRANVLRALELAREGRLGRAVVLTPVTEDDGIVRDIRSGATDDTADDTIDDAAGICAAALVTANPDAEDAAQAMAVARAVRLLLSDTVAVETLDDAAAAMAATSHRFTRAVTRVGDLVNTVGGVGGSSSSHSDLSLVARRDKALAQAADLQAQVDALDVQVEQARAERDRARLAVDHAAAMRTETRLKAQQAAAQLAAVTERIAHLERQMRGLNDKRAASDDTRAAKQLTVDDLNRALAAAQSGGDGDADGDELADRERSLDIALNTAREQEMTAKLAWTEADRKAESLARQTGLLRDQANEAAARRVRIAETNERRRQRIDRIRRIAADAQAVAALANRAVTEVTAQRDALQQAASGHDEELKTLRTRRDELEPQVADLAAREHALDVDRERLAAEYGQITQKIADGLGRDVDELIREYGPDQPVPVLDDDGRPVPLDEDDGRDDDDRSDASDDDSDGTASGDSDTEPPRYRTVPYVRKEQEQRLEKARRDLAALGKVNPLAAEEYDALQARNQYLHDQRDDVAKSRDDLMQLIRDLDATMVDVFRGAFDDTAAAFEQVFATLFPGGTGRLRLENPDDLLTTGVIVEASPAGKRVKQLSLLSGGERSLTALALLFAIFTARPSPFYVMDEVEAALDDVNLTRLINALEQLREHAQLIVITHQQRTMSIADALYGVTMRADGVTAVVSQRLERG
ncbi:chromosome segregation protein SMC [Bifidobacterium ramosum]|uniref:Chromosome partition protein Smc n=1 Tax=Bifidobacterium ramosum TaxID=1798158 RepID=A0A6L4X275_9BIFI|nr:chromosome segregation protein SMC [Bifidobacterium ramosum]KAB8289115.1 chromosome segregation protein SMC [Bifidobacterium ramosum]NEG70828.1 chromosome segregation protein SMC [Bifidobacterium ramosum]